MAKRILHSEWNSKEEYLQILKERRKVYLQTYKDKNGEFVATHIPKETHQELKSYCKDNGLILSRLVNKLIIEFLNNNK